MVKLYNWGYESYCPNPETFDHTFNPDLRNFHVPGALRLILDYYNDDNGALSQDEEWSYQSYDIVDRAKRKILVPM